MLKSMMKTGYATLALATGIAAAAPPAAASCVCRHWRVHHHVATRWVHPGWRVAHLGLTGWGPGVGFAALTGVVVDTPPVYNHPYYYGGGPYGNCSRHRLVTDPQGDILGRQDVYIC